MQYSKLIKKRNAMIEAYRFQVPHPAISAIPQRREMEKGPVVLHGSLSSGRFGLDFLWCRCLNGDPLAIKEHKPKNMREHAVVRRELEVESRSMQGPAW